MVLNKNMKRILESKLFLLIIGISLPIFLGLRYVNHVQWEDMRVPLNQTKVNPATSLPDYDFTNVGYLFPKDDESEILYGDIQFPHAYKLGSEICPHIHYEQTSSSTATFHLAYMWTSIGVSTTSFTIITSTDSQATYTSGAIHQIAEFPYIYGTNQGMSSIFRFKVYRHNDSLPNADVLVTDFDVHYQADQLGSTLEYTK